ncbi:MAG: sulfite exporter TauE/SafE family protein, partial [Synergistales bacterium]|nr:sulfite exporter TauE/SafE family protein [Synergistales bacterium]
MTAAVMVLATLLGGVTGFINVVAGGGSLLSLPFLIFLGLDASSANATNRVSILLQNLVATGQFKKEGVLSLRESLSLGIPASIGSVAGTLLAVQLDERFLKMTIALLISSMAVLLIARPRMWESCRVTLWPAWAKWPLFLVIGAYGGFLQAGVGFFLIWALVATAGKDLLRANALKASIALCFTAVSFV